MKKPQLPTHELPLTGVTTGEGGYREETYYVDSTENLTAAIRANNGDLKVTPEGRVTLDQNADGLRVVNTHFGQPGTKSDPERHRTKKNRE